MCGPNEKLIAQEIIDKVEGDNITDLSNKNISEVIPFIASADMYVGNDSFGSHISSQSGKPSLVILWTLQKHIRIILLIILELFLKVMMLIILHMEVKLIQI